MTHQYRGPWMRVVSIHFFNSHNVRPETFQKRLSILSYPVELFLYGRAAFRANNTCFNQLLPVCARLQTGISADLQTGIDTEYSHLILQPALFL